mgnify:CR=1 FL=1
MTESYDINALMRDFKLLEISFSEYVRKPNLNKNQSWRFRRRDCCKKMVEMTLASWILFLFCWHLPSELQTLCDLLKIGSLQIALLGAFLPTLHIFFLIGGFKVFVWDNCFNILNIRIVFDSSNAVWSFSYGIGPVQRKIQFRADSFLGFVQTTWKRKVVFGTEKLVKRSRLFLLFEDSEPVSFGSPLPRNMFFALGSFLHFLQEEHILPTESQRVESHFLYSGTLKDGDELSMADREKGKILATFPPRSEESKIVLSTEAGGLLLLLNSNDVREYRGNPLQAEMKERILFCETLMRSQYRGDGMSSQPSTPQGFGN